MLQDFFHQQYHHVWKTTFLLKWSLFKGHVNFPGCTTYWCYNSSPIQITLPKSCTQHAPPYPQKSQRRIFGLSVFQTKINDTVNPQKPSVWRRCPQKSCLKWIFCPPVKRSSKWAPLRKKNPVPGPPKSPKIHWVSGFTGL